MTWPVVLIVAGVLTSLVLWAIFAYVAVRGSKAEIPDARFAASLDLAAARPDAAIRILLAIDGSLVSAAAVREVARCPLPAGSTVELLYAIHSRLPVIPDFPPWAVTIAAAHGQSVRQQALHAPEVLTAAQRYLQAHQPAAAVITRIVDGVPKDEILREADVLGADRIVLGSHGRGRGQRVVLGSTAAAVAADARCTVHIVRAEPHAPEARGTDAVSIAAAKPDDRDHG